MDGRDLVLLGCITAYAGGAFALSPVACTLGFAASVLLLGMRSVVRPRGALVLAAIFAVSSLRSVVAEGEARRTYEAARRLAFPGTECDLVGRVAASPQARGGASSIVLEASEGSCRDRAVSPGTLFSVTVPDADLCRGDRVRVSGRFAPVYAFENTELLPSWTRFARTKIALSGFARETELVARGDGVATFIDRARARARRRIQATYHPDAEALGRALVLGETDLDEDVSEAFRATGLSHILAVSGTHLMVTVLAVTNALRALLVRWSRLAQRVDVNRLVAAAGIPFCWLYTDFAGGSGSVVRAAAMMTAVLGARLLDRKPSAARSLAFAIMAGIAFDPVVVADVSFTLSAAATCGLLVLKEPVAKWMGVREGLDVSWPRRAWSFVADPVATTLGATLACAPITAILSSELPVAGLAANLVAAPLGEAFALPFAVAHVMLGPIPALELGAARVASGALLGVLEIAKHARDLHAALPVPPPTGAHLAVLATGWVWISGMTTAKRRRLGWLALALGLTTVEAGVRHHEQPRGVVRVTALDVGQGDAIAVDLPDGSFMLVDAGGLPGQSFDMGRRVVAPVLRARRRSRIDVVVLSHPHPDHYGGLATTIAQASSIGEVWDNGHAGEHGNATVAAVLEAARAKGAVVRGPSELCDAPRSFGGATVEVLAPCPSLDPAASVNDGSLVVKITFGRRAVLLMGDAEHEAEERLVTDRGSRLAADLLKVGHHGSKTSTTPELVAAVRPTHAVISSGVRNRFGHPNRETLETLEAAGVNVARTDIGGSYAWTTDGDRVWTSR